MNLHVFEHVIHLKATSSLWFATSAAAEPAFHYIICIRWCDFVPYEELYRRASDNLHHHQKKAVHPIWRTMSQ